MWVDNLPPGASWTNLWSEYIRCGKCSGIRTLNDLCPACGADLQNDVEQTIRLDDGREISVPSAFMGAETRFEDYVYLQLMEREWKRMMRDSTLAKQMPFTEQVSIGASIVLLFWTYFETRLEHLLRGGLQHIPPPFLEDALSRYSSVGARLKRFYKIAFDSTYHSDLVYLGYSDVSTHRGHVNMCVNVIRRQPSLVSVQRRFRPCRRHPGRRPSSVPAPSASGTCSPPPAASSRSQLSPCPPS